MTNSEKIAILTERQELARIIDEAKARMETLTDAIKADMGDETLLIVGPYKVTWKEQVRSVADTDALKAAGIFDKFSKVQVTRPFKVYG